MGTQKLKIVLIFRIFNGILLRYFVVKKVSFLTLQDNFYRLKNN